jgi:hypothetical protein
MGLRGLASLLGDSHAAIYGGYLEGVGMRD